MQGLEIKAALAGALASMMLLLAGSPAMAAKEEPSRTFTDGIAAVVNQNVITLGQVDAELRTVQAQMQRQNIPVPDTEILQRQVLERLISRELENQEARRLNIEVTDAHVTEAIAEIAGRNNLSVDQLRREIGASGVSWDDYKADLRQEVQLDMLRQRVVDNTIMISDAEVDAFLRTEGRQLSLMQSQPGDEAMPPVGQAAAPDRQAPQAAPQVLELAHILVAVPEGAAAGRVSELRQKAESLRARLLEGADFAGLAASSSDGPQALEGGYMGVRPVDGWPDLFIEAVQGLQPGDISAVFQSGNGFHILKVVGTDAAAAARPAASAAQPSRVRAPAASDGQPDGPLMVTQTRARHILVKPSQVMSDEQAQHRLVLLQQRLVHGEDFADLAKRYSEDPSAPQGGDLGWLTPGETVPAFEQVMDTLAEGQVSEPVRSQFGWHLIKVEERRTKDMADEFRRMRARQILFERRVGPALEDWLSHLRAEAYIENRLEPRADRGRR